MDCNNTHCLWNAFDQCCPESEELHRAAIPNTLDCPSAMRSDHQEAMHQIMDEVYEMMYRRNFRELIQIHKYIKNQRKAETKKSFEFVNGSKIEPLNNVDGVRGITSEYIFGIDLARD